MTRPAPNHPIVVGIDGSSSAARAARWAAVQARRRRLPLRLVHTYEIPLGYPPGIFDPNAVRTGIEEQGRRWLREARQAVAEVAPDVRIELALQRGAVVPTLVQESHDAALVVLGPRGLGAFTGLLVGSTSVALAGHAHCPVVVARGRRDGEAPPLDGPVVVGVDGTPAGEAAIAFAFEEAAARGSQLIAVHTWTDSPLEAALAGSAAPESHPLGRRAAETLAERLAGWMDKYPDVPVAREVVRDRPFRALLHHAEYAALVVVGTRGRNGFRSLILGSTSQHLLYHAPCPVAVVRTDTDE